MRGRWLAGGRGRTGEADLVGVSMGQVRKLGWGDSVRYDEIKHFFKVYLGGRSKGNW